MTLPQRIFKDIAALYPWPLVLLTISPWVLGCFIDFDLLNSRDLIISLVWIPVFTIPCLLLKSRLLWVVVKTLYFILGFLSLFHWILLQGPISLTSIMVLSNTNFQEASEFMDLKSSWLFLLLIPYTLLYLFSLRHRPMLSGRAKLSRTLWVIGLGASIFIAENAIHGRLVRKGIPSSSKVAFSFYEKYNLFKQASKSVAAQEVDARATYAERSQTFVLILGESCNRNHLSLYGYDRKTSPKLDAREDILMYNDVVSPYSNTLESVLTMLSESNLENGIEITQGIDLIDIFHSAGFKTYWISNQSPIGVWDNMVTVMANSSDYLKFANLASNSSFEATYTASYDGKLLEPFAMALDDSRAERKFIVLHLLGNHTNYKMRYPSEFDQFKGDSKKSNRIAEYDNSLLYTDYVVDSIFSILEEKSSTTQNRIATAIYTSDHGENVYDELDKAGHDYAGYLPKANVEIPFLLWCSNEYKSTFKENFETITSQNRSPFITDDLFHSIMDLNGIESPYLDKSRSIFNKEFNSKRTRILEDNEDYDLKVGGRE